jgi:hypothetical protein
VAETKWPRRWYNPSEWVSVSDPSGRAVDLVSTDGIDSLIGDVRA